MDEDEIVISGLSGRFPESSNTQEFWNNLVNGVDMVTSDSRRWTPGLHGLPPRNGKLKRLDHFDNTYFGVHAKQSKVMDPQLRILLEVAVETVLDSGVNPGSLRGSQTGVFVAAMFNESAEQVTQDSDKVTGYELLGNCFCMFANRVSYALDLRGPSLTLDTACSSSLVALAQALSSIRTGMCESALVCGVNVVLKPNTSLQFSRLGMLSPDGSSKAFDVSGNGYVRSEIVGAVFLQRASVARRIYATVLHAKANSDGAKEQGITFPSAEAQRELLERVYEEAGVDPGLVTYVEAHGTGTKIGDPQEMTAITQVFCCPSRVSPLLVGSVKSNMGHAESGSGLAGLAKVVLAMQNGIIPANLHFVTPNSEIGALQDGRIRVVSSNVPWDGGLVGISSFGFGGANAHCLLQSYKRSEPVTSSCRLPLLCPFAGRDEQELKSAMNVIGSQAKNSKHLVRLVQQVTKDPFPLQTFRGYAVVPPGNDPVSVHVEQVPSTQESSPPVWFVFSGMGTQWPGMGCDLMTSLPVFQNSITRLHDCLLGQDFDLLRLFSSEDAADFDNVTNCFVGIAAMQVAIVDSLKEVGVIPDGIVGHSVGELGCAYADGGLTGEQTVLAALARGRAIEQSNLPPGAMAAVGLTWEEAKLRCPPGIYPACHNAKDSVSISGPVDTIVQFVEQLKLEGVFAREVKSAGQAFHSKYISEAGPKLRSALTQIIGAKPAPRSSRWISTSVPESAWGTALAKSSSAAYHVNNLLSPVLFQEGVSHIPPGALVLEIAPHSLLQALLKRSLPSSVKNIGLLSRTAPNLLNHFFSSLGRIYNAGKNLDLSRLYPEVPFPVPLDTPQISPLVTWDHSVSWDVVKFPEGGNSGQTVWEVTLTEEKEGWICGHEIDGRILFPATGYLSFVWRTLAKRKGVHFTQLPVIFENVSFLQATICAKDAAVRFLLNLSETSGYFEIEEGGSVAVAGTVSCPDDLVPDLVTIPDVNVDVSPLLDKDVYKELRLRGYDYKGLFQGISHCDPQGHWGQVMWKDNWVTFLDTMLQVAILGVDTRLLYLPTRIQKMTIVPDMLTSVTTSGQISAEQVTVKNWKECKILQCHGVEIRGLKTSLAPRRQHSDPVSIEDYRFYPYFSQCPESLNTCLHVVTGIVLENVQSQILQLTELSPSSDVSLILQIRSIIESQPERENEATLIISSEGHDGTNWEKSGIRVVEKESLDTASLDMGTQFAILHEEAGLSRCESSLKEGSFVLVVIHPDAGSNVNRNPFMFNLVSTYETNSGEHLYLFRKIPKTMPLPPRQVMIDQSDPGRFPWLPCLQKTLNESSNDPEYPSIYIKSIGTSGLIGLLCSLRKEPGGKKLRCIYSVTSDDDVTDGMYKQIVQSDLVQNVLSRGQWGSFRHVQTDLSEEGTMTHAYVNTLVRGDLSSLRWVESPLKHYTPVCPEEVMCTVSYAPLNFRDIMLATGKLPPDALPGSLASEDCVLGLEFSGWESVTGNRVMGIVPAKGLATHVVSRRECLWSVPPHWTLEEAGTVPVVFATAYYCLVVRGQLQPGETVLIHSGSGGVGQAAISIALALQCTVYVTVGSEEKRKQVQTLFPSLTPGHFGNSRDGSFEQMILQETKGRGVDVVLNSLAGDQLQASIRCLAMHGRFLEIGKADLSADNPLGMAVFLKNVSFHGILLDALFDLSEGPNHAMEQVHKLVQKGIQDGIVRPLPFRTFPSDQVEDAFRFMASGKHIGKVLLHVHEDLKETQVRTGLLQNYFGPNRSAVIVGGLGAVGLELGAWLVERGVRTLFLISRTGVWNAYAKMKIDQWTTAGCHVTVTKCDIGNIDETENTLVDMEETCEIESIFNLAMVLNDALLENQSEDSFRSVSHGKVRGTVNLDFVTRKHCQHLKHFVVFSSVSSGRGNAGQSNYAWANSFMERLCEERRRSGFPGVAIQWGAIGQVGVVQDNMVGQETIIAGTQPQTLSSVLHVLDRILSQSFPPPVISALVLARKVGRAGGEKCDEIVGSISRILGLNTDVSDPNLTLADLGLDSLQGVEVKQKLEAQAGVTLTIKEIRNLTWGNLKLIHNPPS